MNLLIVDDEYYCVENIKNILDWDSLGFSSVFLAYSMPQAQKIFAKYAIDLMICDIEMPHGSGIDLLAWIRESHIETECIFLTCYAKFDYASGALKLGSIDYILKPVTRDSLIASVQIACKKIKEKQQEKMQIIDARHWNLLASEHLSGIWLNIILGNIPSEYSSIKSRFEKYNLPTDNLMDDYFPILIHFFRDNRKWSTELFDASLENIIKEAIRPDPKQESITIKMCEDQYLILARLSSLGQRRFLTCQIEAAHHALCHILPAVFRFYYSDNYFDVESVADAYKELKRHADEDVLRINGIQCVTFGKKLDPTCPLIESVKNYIREHLSEDIARNDIATAVHVSPDYLSHKFREEVGQSIPKYILSKRILLAEKLLSQGDQSIRDVAIHCGFQNISYFSHQFKSMTGKAPQEYSKRK